MSLPDSPQQTHADTIPQNVSSELDTDDEKLLEARLCCVAELAKSAPNSFEESSDQIITFLLKDILPISPDEASMPIHSWKVLLRCLF